MNNKQGNIRMTMEEFDEILDIKYIKYQIKFTLKMIQHITHYFYHDRSSIDCISSMVMSLFEEIENLKTDNKKKLRTIDNYISEKFEELSSFNSYDFPEDDNRVWIK